MMPLSETVSDLFVGNFTGLCEIFQNVYILNFKRTKKLCFPVYMSEITHPNHIQAYLLRNYKVVFCPTRSVPI